QWSQTAFHLAKGGLVSLEDAGLRRKRFGGRGEDLLIADNYVVQIAVRHDSLCQQFLSSCSFLLRAVFLIDCVGNFRAGAHEGGQDQPQQADPSPPVESSVLVFEVVQQPNNAQSASNRQTGKLQSDGPELRNKIGERGRGQSCTSCHAKAWHGAWPIVR